MDERTLTIILRLIHILGGIFWVGAMIMLAGFLIPDSACDRTGRGPVHANPHAAATAAVLPRARRGVDRVVGNNHVRPDGGGDPWGLGRIPPRDRLRRRRGRRHPCCRRRRRDQRLGGSKDAGCWAGDWVRRAVSRTASRAGSAPRPDGAGRPACCRPTGYCGERDGGWPVSLRRGSGAAGQQGSRWQDRKRVTVVLVAGG